MEIIEANSVIGLLVIVGAAIVLAPVVQMAWTMRILMASYVALSLVLIIPEKMVFVEYAAAVYYVFILILFALVEKGRFFNVSEWSVGRFSVQACSFSVLVWSFIVASIMYAMPFPYVSSFVDISLYRIFVEHLFYFAIAPLLFAILFSKHLR